MTPTREQVIEWAQQSGFGVQVLNSIDGDEALTECCGMRVTDELARLAAIAYSAGRLKGLDEAKGAFSISEHMHARNSGLMLCISDLTAVMLRMVAGIDHLSEIARQWEPDHSSGSDRRGWVMAKDARDDALKLLKEHAAAIDQLKEQTP